MINKKRLVDTFLELVKIDSPSGEEKQIATVLLKKLQALGGKGGQDAYGNIIMQFSGEGKPFMINSHMDTVEPGRDIKPIVDGDTIKTDGTTVLGGDAKAGLAIILESLTSLKEDKKRHTALEVVLTVEEETGLIGATHLDYTKITAQRGIAFDGSKDVQNVTVSAPGYDRIDITIIGKAAHAGSEPEKGLSAIQIASEIISNFKLGRIDNETTANIGLIEGGSARNAVPEKVEIHGEIRSRNLKKLEQHTQHFKETIGHISKKYKEAKIITEVKREFNPYHFLTTNPTLEQIRKTLEKMGLSLHEDFAGGGSDVQIFHNHGIEAVVLGIGDYNPHTTREFVKISEMYQGVQFAELLVQV